MTARVFTEASATLAPLSGKSIVFLGYGNQGRAQALNLRDTFRSTTPPVSPAPNIAIANRSDTYHPTARADGFLVTTDFRSAAKEADIVFLLIPDQFQPQIFNQKIGPNLKKGSIVVVASGYNVFYKLLEVPDGVGVVMVAPRMIGAGVRKRYLDGSGYPCFVSVEAEAENTNTEEIALSLALGVGALKAGAVECSARDETLMDLFAEQALWPSVIVAFREGYEVLKKLGCSDEALVHEMWLSKEAAEVFEKCADDGFIRQLRHHSSVSQYGQLKTSLEGGGLVGPMREFYKKVAEKRILDGEFAKEFSEVEKSEGGVEKALDELYKRSEDSELVKGETRVRERLGLDKK